MEIHEVCNRNNNLIMNLTGVWEDSVCATHKFLSFTEINEIKKYVPQALNTVEHLIVAENENKYSAFMGIENKRLEMLFVLSEQRGRGLGKKLLKYGIDNFLINEVTVNEQNPQAVGFYEHMGFKTYKRTEFDEQGNPYPLLYMTL